MMMLILRSVLAVSAVCLLGSGLFASTDNLTIDLAARAKGAERIVVAKVSDVHASFSRNSHGDQLIVSQVVLDVMETLKGSPTSVLSVDIEGGTIGDLTLRVSDMPQLEQGERAVFFLDRSSPDRHTLHRRGLGVLKLDSDDRIRGTSMTLPKLKSIVPSVKR